MELILIVALPFVLFGYLIHLILGFNKKRKSGEMSPAKAYIFSTLLLIPLGFCTWAMVIIIGVFTGVIPLM